jgi:hypothetical protein
LLPSGVSIHYKIINGVLTNARWVRQSSADVFAFISLREMVLPATATLIRNICTPVIAYAEVL